jgi:RNA polymerase sigma-70 factor (ECF subfamily)
LTGEHPNDQALIDDIVKGDEQALAQFYERFSARAYGIALKVLRNAAEAEDVLQETFMEIWRSATRYNPLRGLPERWVATIARTRAIDRLRKRQSQQRTAEASGREVLTSTPTVDDQLALGEDVQKLRGALSQLPTEQREVIELAYFQGLSQSDISEKTGLPLGTVKTRVRLGLLKLAAAVPG